MADEPFWRTKTLHELSQAEWESLCDGCGRCCLVKIEEDLDDEPVVSGETPNPDIYFTDIGCRLLDAQSCRCKNYPGRTKLVSDCVRLTPDVVGEIGWLPPSCAYRLVAEGRDLYWWHPLVSGDPETVHQAGVSVRGKVAGSEDEIDTATWEDRIVGWPLRLPKRAATRPTARSHVAKKLSKASG
ncbi:hypothetical protein GJW-30_1_03807 [Variibacter gotjawalensis]|uniref:UPF0260 protein GJW-30_1_03807 n=1 Tax=Variibacter gotjawalensis TaxID=1333996 RepID=A0A0S3PZA0_9BRAD|nr:YcgN family cysteine cluster protein [Variibacter gotjawalensis]NIK47088.1 hypothetical protein [Variibacter gotjawalensis]RZS48990.1 hypothetical protein EV661_1414 [Variibacter gotjawalensis]BAT61250.1 hypothetical protein GJW-30_1_03807 [Variibacter gotjawalensis]